MILNFLVQIYLLSDSLLVLQTEAALLDTKKADLPGYAVGFPIIPPPPPTPNLRSNL